MAKLDEYWGQIQQSESFQDLDVAQKEKVRNHLWDQYVQKSPSYTGLPVSQRNQVRKHFDDLTQIQPESLGQDLMKKGKKAIDAIKPVAQKIGSAISSQVDLSKAGSDIEDIGSTAEELPGMKKVASTISEGVEKTATAIEPNFIKPSLTDYDVARAIGAGAVRTVGDFISGLIPETTMGAAAYAVPADALMKYAGLTFPALAKERNFPWKPKTGIASDATSLGDQFEKIVTKRRIENNARTAMSGPPKPLEVLANKEEALKAQDEVTQYEEWLKQADQTSARGGEPQGDLYPQAKVNVSQLRDAAQDRLTKLQNEPVRINSISNVEDELQGYYRRKVDQARVYMMPSGPATEPQALLGEGEKPAGLLKSGEEPTKQAAPRRPATTATTPDAAPTPSPKVQTPTPTAPAPTTRAKDVLFKMYQAYNPDQPKQANAIRAGALLKSLGIRPMEELSEEHMNMLEKVLESEHQERMVKETKRSISKDLDTGKIKEKGLEPEEVKAEAKRLAAEHEANRSTLLEKRQQLKQVTGGIGFHDVDPMTGRRPEAQEVMRNVPLDLRGKTKPDQAAQMAHEAGLIPGPSSNDLYNYTKGLEAAGKPRSINSFLDQAEYNLELQKQREAGFKPEPQSLPGMPQSQMPGSPMATPESPQDITGDLFTDLKEKSAFDLTSDFFKNMGEKGQIGGEIDPVKQAAQEAIIKELVDRAMSMGYHTTQDIMLYAARNAPAEIQAAIRKNLAPTLSAFDEHPYKEMEQAKQGNPVAKKSMMDNAQRGYFKQKADIVKGVYKKFKANQQVVLFKDMDEGLMRLKNDLFIHDNYRNFSKDELAAQRWYTEGKSPKLESLTSLGVKEEDAKRWLSLAKNPTEQMKKARQMTQIFEDEYHDVLSEFYDRVGYREDHVTRRWKRPEEYLDWEGKTLSNRPNFLKGAKLLSQAQGIDAGLEPVSFDIREDLRASNNARVNILSRIHAYQKLGASFGPDGMPAIMDESEPGALTQAKNAKITPHSGQAPASWIRTNDVPLLRDLAINPYYKPAIKFMMARPFQGTTPEVLDFLSASTKATKLYGFFHGYTLGEMTMSGISYRDVFSFGKDRNPLFRGLRYLVKGMTADMEGRPLSKNPVKAVGELYHSFITGSGVLANRPLALDMAEHGFKFGSADEDMNGILKKFLGKTEDYLSKRIGEGLAKGLTALPRTALDIQEKALWSYIRPISSMLVYETNLKDAIKEFNLEAEEGKKIPIEELKKAIVNQTSKEMGGISYARLMINPRTQQVLQWAMLAPGWTIGRALMGASVLEKGPEGRQARKQMAKLFVGWFFASNMINYAQTKKYLGKGRYMWENPEEYRNQAFLSKEKDGSTRYIQLSKALTEIYDDLMHPARTAAYKLSAPIQAAAKVMNWATARAYYPGVEPENPLMSLVHAYEPMITSGQSAYGGVPIKKGPSKNKVEGILNEFYSGGMKNQALFEEAMQTGTEQGYDMSKLDRAVRASRTHKWNQELMR